MNLSFILIILGLMGYIAYEGILDFITSFLMTCVFIYLSNFIERNFWITKESIFPIVLILFPILTILYYFMIDNTPIGWNNHSLVWVGLVLSYILYFFTYIVNDWVNILPRILSIFLLAFTAFPVLMYLFLGITYYEEIEFVDTVILLTGFLSINYFFISSKIFDLRVEKY